MKMSRHLMQRIIMPHLLRAWVQLPRPAPLLRPEECLPLATLILQKRMLRKDIEITDHTCEISSYDEYLANHKPIIMIVVQTLEEILGTTTKNANKIIASNPQFKKRSRTNILNNYYNLLEVGVQKDTIAKNVWLLAHETDALKSKLDCINVLNMNNDELIPWIHLTQIELVNYVFHVQNDKTLYIYNKIEHLAHRLECSVQELCEMTVRCSFLLKIPIISIDKKLNILHEYNVSNKNILKDLWVFRYSENHIRHRCELYKDTECSEMKTWAIRCPLKIISKAIQRNHMQRGLMQYHKTIGEYLMNKLKVDESTLQFATTKWPAILRVNLVKLDNLIKILHENGITSNDILQHGRIFCFNIKTVQKRIEILKKEDLIPRLTLLILAEHSFEQYIKKHQMKRELLKFQEDVNTYLMRRLNVDEKTLASMTSRWPHILRVNILKLAQMIDMLHQNDITNKEILRHGRVFQFNTETLRQRLEILKKNGLAPKITVITYSQKTFNQYIESHGLSK